MAISNANQQLAILVSSNSTTSYEELLESQKELISKQIYELQNIVSKQCKLTGVNPLSQEMAAGALSIKIGKRPRDLLNPKAIKYMQSIFSVKDEINKKEIRAISALFGLTATQVRDFFNGQRSRVRKFIRLSREKAVQSTEGVQEQDRSLLSNVDLPNHPVPLNSVGPSSIEALSYSMQDEGLQDTDDSDKYFIANIFNLLRKEETFSGQEKLMEWILQIQNASVLYWFLTNGGVMILVSWLSQAAIDEQTTVLHVILRVLCHLPLHRAVPAHMSAILQSVNKLRFYRGSDISNRAKSLLSKWSKVFARSHAMRRPDAHISSVDAQNEILLKQSIGEIMENESLESRIDNHALQENSENSRSQSIKLLTGPSDDSNMKLLRDTTRERRKVQLVEQPGQKPQVTRILSTNQGGRPLSADDIQKAKMRAQFMRSKYGESSPKVPVPPRVHVHPKVLAAAAASKPHGVVSGKGVSSVHGKKGIMDLEEAKCKISWVIPPEMKINKEWSVCCGENSKEIDVQNNRIRREKEVFYNTVVEIPPNPKEPWDREMDYDDSLTPEIPTDQLPDDDDNMVVETDNCHYAAAASTSRNTPGPDLELLAVLLKNPQIVFALTAGQGGSLTNEQMVKLLDAIKAHGGSIDSLVNGLVDDTKAEPKFEVSLPSPTPSVTTSGWRQESGKNHFSRQSVTVKGDAYSIPGVYFQDPISHQRVVPDRITIPSGMPTANQAAIHLTDHRSIPPAASSNSYLLPERHETWEANPYSRSTNYNVFGTGVGPSWARYGDGPGFESWSPNNSPGRSHEPRYNYMSRVHNDTSRRNDGSWWRDRRR